MRAALKGILCTITVTEEPVLFIYPYIHRAPPRNLLMYNGFLLLPRPTSLTVSKCTARVKDVLSKLLHAPAT